MGGVLQLFQKSTVLLEMLLIKPLEHLWNCCETFLKYSSIIKGHL